MKKCKRCGRIDLYMRYKNMCDSCYNGIQCRKNGYKWQKAWRLRQS